MANTKVTNADCWSGSRRVAKTQEEPAPAQPYHKTQLFVHCFCEGFLARESEAIQLPVEDVLCSLLAPWELDDLGRWDFLGVHSRTIRVQDVQLIIELLVFLHTIKQIQESSSCN